MGTWVAFIFCLLKEYCCEYWGTCFELDFLNFFRCKPRSGVAGLCGSCRFNFLRKRHTVFHSCFTYLQPQQQYTRVPFSPMILQHLLFEHFLMIAILTSVKWYLIVISTCISLLESSAGNIFMFLWDFHVSSLEKCLFISSANLGDFFSYLVVWAVCILWILSLSVPSFANIFSHSIACNFVWSISFFAVQCNLSLIKSHSLNLPLFLFPWETNQG